MHLAANKPRGKCEMHVPAARREHGARRWAPHRGEMDAKSDPIIEHLVEQAEDQCSLTEADIIAVVPEAAADADVMERLVRLLAREGVDVESPAEEVEAEEAEDDGDLAAGMDQAPISGDG